MTRRSCGGDFASFPNESAAVTHQTLVENLNGSERKNVEEGGLQGGEATAEPKVVQGGQVSGWFRTHAGAGQEAQAQAEIGWGALRAPGAWACLSVDATVPALR